MEIGSYNKMEIGEDTIIIGDSAFKASSMSEIQLNSRPDRHNKEIPTMNIIWESGAGHSFTNQSGFDNEQIIAFAKRNNVPIKIE